MRGIETSIPSVVRGGKPVTEARKGSARSLEATRADLIAKCTGEQAEADRRRPRRVDDIARRPPQSERQNLSQPTVSRTPQSGTKKPWKRSEQALKATDDLLHSGGWGLVVLDLGSISWVDARRIPLSTWFRFQRIVENTPTILLLVGEEPCAKGCASVALRCRRGPEKWRRAGSSKIPAGIATLQGFEVEGEVVRSRTRRGPGDSARWEARTVWSGSS